MSGALSLGCCRLTVYEMFEQALSLDREEMHLHLHHNLSVQRHKRTTWNLLNHQNLKKFAIFVCFRLHQSESRRQKSPPCKTRDTLELS